MPFLRANRVSTSQQYQGHVRPVKDGHTKAGSQQHHGAGRTGSQNICNGGQGRKWLGESDALKAARAKRNAMGSYTIAKKSSSGTEAAVA